MKRHRARAATRHDVPASYDPPAGWWRIVVRSGARTNTVSAPEGPDSGDYVLQIAGVEPGRLTFAPITTCPLLE